MTCQSSKERQDLAEGAKQPNLDESDGFDDDNHGLDDDYHDVGDDDGDVDHDVGYDDHDDGDDASDDDHGVGPDDHDDADDADGHSDEYENDYDHVSDVDYGDYAMILIMIAKRRMALKVSLSIFISTLLYLS